VEVARLRDDADVARVALAVMLWDAGRQGPGVVAVSDRRLEQVVRQRVELRGRGDIQLFRVEVPGPRITRDIASDAKVRLSVPRTEFNELVKDGSIRHWREVFESGHVKASGPSEILKLIQSVVLKQEERTRSRKLRTR